MKRFLTKTQSNVTKVAKPFANYIDEFLDLSEGEDTPRGKKYRFIYRFRGGFPAVTIDRDLDRLKPVLEKYVTQSTGMYFNMKNVIDKLKLDLSEFKSTSESERRESAKQTPTGEDIYDSINVYLTVYIKHFLLYNITEESKVKGIKYKDLSKNKQGIIATYITSYDPIVVHRIPRTGE